MTVPSRAAADGHGSRVTTAAVPSQSQPAGPPASAGRQVRRQLQHRQGVGWRRQPGIRRGEGQSGTRDAAGCGCGLHAGRTAASSGRHRPSPRRVAKVFSARAPRGKVAGTAVASLPSMSRRHWSKGIRAPDVYRDREEHYTEYTFRGQALAKNRS